VSFAAINLSVASQRVFVVVVVVDFVIDSVRKHMDTSSYLVLHLHGNLPTRLARSSIQLKCQEMSGNKEFLPPTLSLSLSLSHTHTKYIQGRRPASERYIFKSRSSGL
jgi:hypothetical protein